jgi:hypothetical protein
VFVRWSAKNGSAAAFCSSEITETAEDVRLTITAPERARDAADALFELFVPPGT